MKDNIEKGEVTGIDGWEFTKHQAPNGFRYEIFNEQKLSVGWMDERGALQIRIGINNRWDFTGHYFKNNPLQAARFIFLTTQKAQ